MQVAFDSIQPTVNKLLKHQPISRDEEESMIRFFEWVSKDKEWLSAHQDESKNLLKAVTYFYLTTDHTDSIAKIKATVNDSRLLAPYMPEDVAFKVPSVAQTSSASLLNLATHSSYFDTMFRGPYAEGKKVQELDGAAVLEINSISPKAAKAYLEWLKDKTIGTHELSAQELHELCVYADGNETLDQLITPLEKSLLKDLNPARALELHPFLESIGGMIELKIAARRMQFTFLNDKAAFNGFKTGKLAESKFQALAPDDIKELCKDYLICRAIDLLNASKPEGHVFLANFEAILPQIKNLSLPWLRGCNNKLDTRWILENMNKETTELNLANSPYSGDFYMVEKRFPDLRVLDMSGIGTFYNLLAFSSLPKLQILHIRDCINLKSLAGMEELPLLEELDVRGSPISPEKAEQYKRKGLKVIY